MRTRIIPGKKKEDPCKFRDTVNSFEDPGHKAAAAQLEASRRVNEKDAPCTIHQRRVERDFSG